VTLPSAIKWSGLYRWLSLLQELIRSERWLKQVYCFLLEQYLSGTLFLKPASMRILSPQANHPNRYSALCWRPVTHAHCTDSEDFPHRIPDAAPSHALSGLHTPFVVIRQSGLTIIELELELEPDQYHLRSRKQCNNPYYRSHIRWPKKFNKQ